MEISFGDEKHGQQIWVICLLCDLPPNFSPKKISYGLFLDRRLRVQNLMKNLSSFLRTGLMKVASLRKFRMRFAGVWFGTSLSFNRWSFGERRTKKYPWFEAEFSSIHRSTSTSTTPWGRGGLKVVAHWLSE